MMLRCCNFRLSICTVAGGTSAKAAKTLPRFTEKKHDCLPPQVEQWAEVLAKVDTTRPSPVEPHRWGYYIPAADFLLTPKSAQRLQLYLANWLHARQATFAMLSRLSTFQPPPHKFWASFVGRFPPRTPEQQAAMVARAVAEGKPKGDDRQTADEKAARYDQQAKDCQYFSQLLGQPFPVGSPIITSYVWRRDAGDVTLQFDLFNDALRDTYPLVVLQEIAWELSEVAFRIELFELDRRKYPDDLAGADYDRRADVARVFPPGHFVTTLTRPVPGDGLGARDLRARARALEQLRQLMLRWPGHPPAFDTSPVLTQASPKDDLKEFERAAAAYYCQTFYEVFGRAASVPRLHPA